MSENDIKEWAEKVKAAKIRPYMSGYDYLQEVRVLTAEYKTKLEDIRLQIYKTFLIDIYTENTETTENCVRRATALDEIECIMPALDNLQNDASLKNIKEVFREILSRILSPKETQILHLISQGKTQDEITAILGYAKGSLKQQLKRIGDRLSNTLKDKKTFSEVLAENGLIELTDENTIKNVFKTIQFLVCDKVLPFSNI